MAEAYAIDYRGYQITFSENREVWWCQSLDIDGEKLSTVKAKIDRVIVASRKISNVPAIYKDSWDRATDVTLVAIAQPRKERDGSDKEPAHAWCMVPGKERYFVHGEGRYGYRDTLERKKLELARLYKDTAENRALMTEAVRLEAEREQLAKKKKDLLAKAEPLVLAGLPVGDPSDGLSS